MVRVTVVMSAYNGERYIEEQILSILNQKGVMTSLYVRDDGSTDSTTDVIRKLQKRYPDRIRLEQGKNVGYKVSFLKALAGAGESEFYAFSDQDDYWLEDKCARALEKMGDGCELYASAQILTDEALNETGVKQFSDVVPTLEGEFTRHRLPGCTYLFTRKVRDMAVPYADIILDQERFPSHDMIIACLALSIGKICIDDHACMKYRRLSSSITPGGQGIKKRINHEFEYLFHNKNRYSFMAASILERYAQGIEADKLAFLRCAANYRDSIGGRMKLLTNPRMDCGVFLGNLESKIKIILGSY